MSSVSLSPQRELFTQEWKPAVYALGASEGKAEIVFYYNGIPIHNEFITVTRMHVENRTVCTVKGKVRRLSLSTSFELPVSDETIAGSEHIDFEQLNRATKTALAKIQVHAP
jgi:hypothetical protein